MQTMPDVVLRQSTPNDDAPNGTPADKDSSKQNAERDGALVETLPIKGESEWRDIAGRVDLPRLSLAKTETHRLWHEDGLSVETVAEVRCNKVSTVLGYIAGMCIRAWVCAQK